jgi:HEAT repeat protein
VSDLDALTAKLRAADPKLRLDAAERLCHMAEAAAPAAADLVRACGDTDEQVREWAVAALEGLGPPPEASVPKLVSLVTSESPLASYWAITLLGRVGQAAKAAVPVLTACLGSADEAVRRRAAWAIEKIGPA